MYFNSVKTFSSMNIQNYLSNKTINGIVHCILVQRGHIKASDIQVVRYRHRCAYTGSAVWLYWIKAFLTPQTYFFYKILHIITYLSCGN